MADFQEINENEPAAENQKEPAAAEGDEANCSLANHRQDRNTPESGVVSDESSSSSGSETGRISYSFFIPSLTIDKTVGKDEDISMYHSVSNANRQQRQQNMINELKLRRQLEMKTREKPQPSVTETVTIEELRKRFNEQVCSLLHRNSSKGFGNHKSFLEPLEFPSPIAPVIHPSEFDPPNLSTTDRSEPEFGCDPLVVYFHSRLFLLDTWPRFAQSENPARREMAANNFLSIFHPKGPLSGNIEQLEEMFSLIENLLLDEALEVRRAAQKHIPRCAELCKAMAEEEPWFWDQFNHRIPAMLVRLLLEKLHNAPISLWTLEQLMEADLLKDEAVQNMVVPGLFCFLSQSNHFFTQYDRAMRPPKEKNYNVRLMSDDEEDEELKHILRLETLRTEMQMANSQATLNVFRILNSILAKATDKLLLSADGGSSSTTANCAAQMDWVRSQLVPQMADYFSAEQRLLWQRDIREQMANSLAPLAHWMGREGADTKLLPIFQLFMQHDAVQCSAIKHLAAFCQILSEDCREILVRELSQLVILNADTRWRQRAEFAEQLSHLVPLFPAQSVNKYLSAFALTFSADRISEVRNKGIGMLAAVLGAFIRMEWTNSDQDNNKTNSSTGDEEVVQAEMDNANAATGTATTAAAKSSTSTESTLTSTVTASQAEPPPSLPLTDKLLAEIRSGFWRTRNWRRRQSFGRLLYLLVQRRLLSDEHFYLLFIHDFISLSDDDVSNVRQYFYLLAQLNQFEMFGNGVRNRLETMAVQDSDLENRTLAKIALGELDPSEDGLDLSGRAVGLTN